MFQTGRSHQESHPTLWEIIYWLFTAKDLTNSATGFSSIQDILGLLDFHMNSNSPFGRTKPRTFKKKKKKSWGEATILNIFLTGERGSLKAKKPTGLILCLKIAQKVAEQVLMTVLNEIIFSLLLYWQAAPCHGVISFNYFYQSTW